MSVTNDQIENLKRFAPTLQAMLDLVAVFEKVDSVDQAVAESNQRLAQARAAEADFKARILTERDDVAAQRAAAAAMTEQAQADATNIVASAQAQAANVLAESQAVLAGKDQELAGLNTLIADANAQFQKQLEDAKALENKVAEFNATVDAKKAALRALVI